MFSAQFRCIASCAGGYPLDQVIYRCPRCGDLLEVVMTSRRCAREPPRPGRICSPALALDRGAVGLGRVGQARVVAPGLAAANIVSMGEARPR